MVYNLKEDIEEVHLALERDERNLEVYTARGDQGHLSGLSCEGLKNMAALLELDWEDEAGDKAGNDLDEEKEQQIYGADDDLISYQRGRERLQSPVLLDFYDYMPMPPSRAKNCDKVWRLCQMVCYLGCLPYRHLCSIGVGRAFTTEACASSHSIYESQ
jgi:hypothetical protein